MQPSDRKEGVTFMQMFKTNCNGKRGFMNLLVNDMQVDAVRELKSMREFGEIFIAALPKHIQALKIPGRKISNDLSMDPRLAQIDEITEIQRAMRDVLSDPITLQAEFNATSAFATFLQKKEVDAGLLKFFNGWYNTHKTTSLVSAKIILRLSGDAIFIPTEQQIGYYRTLAHMHEVAKDDFGLGHKGHDGMYVHMAAALEATSWIEKKYEVPECNEFCEFLYEAGVAEHKSPLNSYCHNESILNAMMISIASETWNGREFNYIAQYIEAKLLSVNPTLENNTINMRDAKGYVMGHAGEVENKHGLHALAAAQIFSRTRGVKFCVERLKKVMLNYNERVGRAFGALHRAMV